jgi:hypothetical protein
MSVKKTARGEQKKDVAIEQIRRKSLDRARNVKKWSVIS